MGQSIIQVDSFTEQAFAGNPAAVCLLESPREELWMQSVAREMNLAETAFLVRCADGFELRWFTPTIEVDLCGHATLASAHVLWEDGHLAADDVARFHTKSGLLTAMRAGNRIEMDFPAEPATEVEADVELAASLGVLPVFVGRNRMDHLVQVKTAAEVRRLFRPDLPGLAALTDRGVMVTARSDTPEFDFVSRFFAPAAGVDEDPVTGSAHCCLGPFWEEWLGRSEMVGYQASARGGTVYVRTAGDRVILGGHAVTVLRAELVV